MDMYIMIGVTCIHTFIVCLCIHIIIISSLSLSPSPSPSLSLSPPSLPPSSGGGSGVATLSDYREQKPDKSAKGDDDAQQFYAGGSEHSGQMIEGPPRKKANPQDIAKEVFEAAKK